ncbi:MAG: GIY-YIG nuclease family protein [Anaerolineae bacterium]
MAAQDVAIGDVLGTYALWLGLECDREIRVGRLGCFQFPAGTYGYVGSALGPGGIGARVARHLRRRGSLHWHVDYLRSEARPIGFWWAAGDKRRECAWAAALAQLRGASLPVAGFGASDCRCSTHLIHLPALPAVGDFARAVGESVTEVHFNA